MDFSNRLGWIGVDLGTRCVKLAQVARTPEGVQLRHAAVIQRQVPWTDADDLARREPDPSRIEIHSAMECSGFRGRNAACLLPMNVCELRGLTVPHGAPKERRAMIANELADDWGGLHFPMEFDFWELDVDRSASGGDVFNVDVMAVARPWVEQVARDCQDAHLDCWAVDGTPTAMARAVQLVEPNHSGARTLAIDWGYSNTTLCVVGRGRPLYARRIHDCGLRNGLAAIQGALGIDADQAQHLVDTQGVLQPGQRVEAGEEVRAAVTTALADVVHALVSEIQRTLRFLELQRRHLSPTSIWLLGGGASVRNIGPHLSQRLTLPVRVWEMSPEPDLRVQHKNLHSQLFGAAVALSTMAWRAA